MKVLRLTLKKQWFDMIASGVKREEYRAPGKWILCRLAGRYYDVIEFKNGYGQNVPAMTVEYCGWKMSSGIAEWGAEPSVEYATIMLGRVLEVIRPEYEKAE
jgi:hypothetical protein